MPIRGESRVLYSLVQILWEGWYPLLHLYVHSMDVLGVAALSHMQLYHVPHGPTRHIGQLYCMYAHI